MSILTPKPLLRHLLDRLRLNYVPTQLYTDDDVLVMLNDAYLEACERSRCLQSLATITLVTDQPEYDLPADFSSANHVVVGGVEVYPVPLSEAQITTTRIGLPQSGYYIYTGKIGFIPAPLAIDASRTTLLAYNATPASFTDLDDTLDPRLPVEFSDLLVHYVVWRVQMLSGGAESIREAQVNRTLAENRTTELRRATDRIESVSPSQIGHVSDRRRLRSGS